MLGYVGVEVGYDLSAVLVDDGPIPKDAFQRLWQSAPADKKVPEMWLGGRLG